MEGSGPEGQAGDLGAPLTSLKPWPAQQEARQRKGQAPVPGEDSGVRDRGPAAVGRSGSAHRPRFKPELCTEGDQARGDRIPEVSRPTPGEAEGAGATRGPASDPSTRQRQLQPRAPTGPRGRWVTATQVPTVRPAPPCHPPPVDGVLTLSPRLGPLCPGSVPRSGTRAVHLPSCGAIEGQSQAPCPSHSRRAQWPPADGQSRPRHGGPPAPATRRAGERGSICVRSRHLGPASASGASLRGPPVPSAPEGGGRRATGLDGLPHVTVVFLRTSAFLGCGPPSPLRSQRKDSSLEIDITPSLH